nr:serine/arginine repetitive matrix protein 1-like [Penaeus vannamei]
MHADTEPHTGRGRGEPPSRRAPSKPSSQRVEGATGAIAPTAGRNDSPRRPPWQPQRRSRFPASGGGVHCGPRAKALRGASRKSRDAATWASTAVSQGAVRAAASGPTRAGAGATGTSNPSAEARGRRSRPPTPQTGRRKRRGYAGDPSHEGGSPWHSRTRASAASAGTRAALFGGGRGFLPLRLQTPFFCLLPLPADPSRRSLIAAPIRAQREGCVKGPAFPLPPPPPSLVRPTPKPPWNAHATPTPSSPARDAALARTPTSSQAPESAAVASRPGRRPRASSERASDKWPDAGLLMQLCILGQRDRGPSPLRVRALRSAPRSPN